jgi:hypothetical protein
MDLSGDRWEESLLLTVFRDGLYDLKRLRSDYYIPFLYDAVIADPQMGSEFPLDDAAYDALAFYVAGHVSLADDEFVSNGRADYLIRQYRILSTGRDGPPR